MKKILLVTPPLLQPNAPYPATAYLAGYLRSRGFEAAQADLSVELLNAVFTPGFLRDSFESYAGGNENTDRIFALRNHYVSTIGCVMSFLRSEDPTMANLICRPDFLPQAASFDAVDDLQEIFGLLGTQDCARYLCTLYLQDICSMLRVTVSEHFEIARYGESLAVSLPSFDDMARELAREPNTVEGKMLEILDKHISEKEPEVIGFSVPFPGNLLAALRCAAYVKEKYPEKTTVIGGGYPTTELRNLEDKRIFDYVDYIVLDDGELALERILSGGELINTYTREKYHHPSATRLKFTEHPGPDFDGLPHDMYFSLFERTNPMHRLWSDGHWNKIILSHGCYWAKCSFCDTSLDYICRYEALTAPRIADQMEKIAAQTGSHGFHFVDEAAPPKLLKELSIELLRRGLKFSWWTNIRFEAGYTGDLCRLMAAAGCIAVSGGLEAASDRLLGMINKGVTIEQATMAMRNFFYAGIMVHSYLMYGLPTQTLQESIDSLEIVRQMFRAQLIDSAFWHRYAMTLHSPMGLEPQKWGVSRKSQVLNNFANNEVRFTENRQYNINLVGDALNEALANYLTGNALERPAHKWFQGKVQPTSVDPGLITDHLIKPDASRLFDPEARIVWIGNPITSTAEGILVQTPSESKEIKFSAGDADFIIGISKEASELGHRITMGQVKEKYQGHNEKPFAELYHSKKWDKLREYGLLQI